MNILGDVEPLKRIQLPVHAGDPDAVFVEVARLLEAYSKDIQRDVEKIAAQCRTRDELEAAQRGYVDEIGANVPDPVIRAAIKRLARVKFKVFKMDA
jgi:hypothetical protein